MYILRNTLLIATTKVILSNSLAKTKMTHVIFLKIPEISCELLSRQDYEILTKALNLIG